MKKHVITKIVDKHLNKLIGLGLNMLPGDIEPEMADPNQDKREEWRIWKAIGSTVNDSSIAVLENQIGHKLPDDYKIFLKYKHFYELEIDELSFCRHAVNTWSDNILEMIFDGYPKEYLLDKGYIPFAAWSDCGLLCFDTTTKVTDYNYPVVLWDHEMPESVEKVFANFYDLIVSSDIKADSNGCLED